LQFLSESALKVASNAYEIYSNLDTDSINKIAAAMQLNESEEIIAMSKGLYNDVNKRTLCAHLGINDIALNTLTAQLNINDTTLDEILSSSQEDSTNTVNANAVNESHIHTIKFSTFEDAEKSASAKGVVISNKFTKMLPENGSPKTAYINGTLVNKSTKKVLGTIKYNTTTRLAAIELENDVHKDSIFSEYVNESAVELNVSVRYAKQANDAFEDAKNIKVTQKSTNTWIVDKNDIDDIKDLLKAWSVKEYEFIDESISAYDLFVSTNAGSPINAFNVQVGYVLGYNNAIVEVTKVDINKLHCIVKLTNNEYLPVDYEFTISKLNNRKVFTKYQDSFVNESSQQPPQPPCRCRA
jgi:hypothetical protein